MTNEDSPLIWDQLGELTVGAPQEFWDKLLVHPEIIEAYNKSKEVADKEGA